MFLDAEKSKENDAFRNSEWGQEAVVAMWEEVKDFAITSGGENKLTLGDLFAWTDKTQISKVMLEEKVFKTWYDCRTVLMGDGKLFFFSFHTNTRAGSGLWSLHCDLLYPNRNIFVFIISFSSRSRSMPQGKIVLSSFFVDQW